MKILRSQWLPESLELMNITKGFASSLKMLCQAYTTDTFSLITEKLLCWVEIR